MAAITCPQCHGDIEPDLIESTGADVCPFCGADLSALKLPEPAPAPESAASASGPTTRPLAPLPTGSRIQVIESTPQRLMLYLPGGGKGSKGMGCFALLWNLFMCVFTSAWFLPGANQQGAAGLGLIAFLALFWAIGLGLTFFWLKVRFERTFVSLERNRIVLQRVLFGRERLDETPLGADARASLAVSYSQNNVPVYRIDVEGTNKTAKFGTSLGNADKNWIVDRFNEFIVAGAPRSAEAAMVFPNTCEQCGSPLTGRLKDGVLVCENCGAAHPGKPAPFKPASADAVTYKPLRAESLPPGCGIVVDESSDDRLRFHYGAAPNAPVKWIIATFALGFGVVWYAAVVFFLLNGPDNVGALLTLPFFAAGLVPLGMGLFCLAGRTTIDLDSERLLCRWHVGGLGYSRSIPTAAIESVRLESDEIADQNPRVRISRPGGTGLEKVCVVRCGGKLLPLTLMHDAEFARLVASLLRTRLDDMGQSPGISGN